MPDEKDATGAPPKPDFSQLEGHQQVAADESTWQKIKRNLTSYDPAILAQKIKTGTSPQEEGEQEYQEAFGSPLEQAYGKAKKWLTEHEGQVSEKYLTPFRQGLDNMASDLQEAAETGHTKSGGQLNPVTRALVGGAATALKAVPIGHDVPETLAAIVTPPEVKPEAALAEKEALDFSKLKGHEQISEPTHGKILYHGTKAPIKDISEADPLGYGDPGALAGIGVYLTDKPEVASGYATGKKAAVSEGGRVLAGRLRKNAKILDLEQSASPEVRETFAREIRSLFPDSKISDSELDNDYFRSPGDKPDRKITGTDLFDGLRRAIVEAGYTKSDATEIMQSVTTELKHTHKFDALKYEGGKRVPIHGSHEVHVVLPDMTTGRVPEGMIKGEVPSKESPLKQLSEEKEKPFKEAPKKFYRITGFDPETGTDHELGIIEAYTRDEAIRKSDVFGQHDLVRDAGEVPPENVIRPDEKSLPLKKSALPQHVIESQGLKYKGELTKGSGVHMFEHPAHPGKTASMNERDITPQNVRDKMKSKIQEFIRGEAQKP